MQILQLTTDYASVTAKAAKFPRLFKDSALGSLKKQTNKQSPAWKARELYGFGQYRQTRASDLPKACNKQNC